VRSDNHEQVIRDLGQVRPFISIVEAEARHISALLALFERYGIAPPENKHLPAFRHCVERGARRR